MNKYKFDPVNHIHKNRYTFNPLIHKEMIGKKYSMLTIVEFIKHESGKHAYYKCICECGKSSIVDIQKLKSGRTKSCGCYVTKKINEYNYKHGMCKTKIYKTWKGIISRCNDEKNSKYGGRGIKVCERWKTFLNFYKDMGDVPFGMTIERINNDGNYEKSNCKWANMQEQANNRRCNHKITFNGKTLTMQQWVRETGINQGTLSQRINKMNWNIDRALTTDPSIYRNR